MLLKGVVRWDDRGKDLLRVGCVRGRSGSACGMPSTSRPRDSVVASEITHAALEA